MIEEPNLEQLDASSDSIAVWIEEGYGLLQSGKMAEAMQRAQHAEIAAAQLSDLVERAKIYAALALLRFRMGQFESARALAIQAESISSPETPTWVDAHLVVGMCASETYDLEAAETTYLKAIEVGRKIGYPIAHFRGLHNLAAGVYFQRGDYLKAIAADQEALSLAKQHQLTTMCWLPLANLSTMTMRMGRLSEAQSYQEELHAQVIPGTLQDGYYLCNEGYMALHQNRLDEAPHYFTQARTIAEANGNPRLGIVIGLGFSLYYFLQRQPNEALHWANEGLELAAILQNQHLHGVAYISRARARSLTDNQAGTISDLENALEILSIFHSSLDQAIALLFLSLIYHKTQSPYAVDTWAVAAELIEKNNYDFLLVQQGALFMSLLEEYSHHPQARARKLALTLMQMIEKMPPQPLHICTLGRFEIWQGTRLISAHSLRQDRANALLALLLLTPQRELPVETAISQLFPEQRPESGFQLLQKAFLRLRQTLEADLPETISSHYLQLTSETLRLILPPGSWLDFELFEQACQQKEWQAALDLYQGELFPSELFYAEWTFAARQRMNTLAQGALLALARETYALGNYSQSLSAALRLLTLIPWHEEAAAIGIRTCLEQGNPHGALRLYKKIEKALQEKLSLHPQKELSELYEQILLRLQ